MLCPGQRELSSLMQAMLPKILNPEPTEHSPRSPRSVFASFSGNWSPTCSDYCKVNYLVSSHFLDALAFYLMSKASIRHLDHSVPLHKLSSCGYP